MSLTLLALVPALATAPATITAGLATLALGSLPPFVALAQAFAG